MLSSLRARVVLLVLLAILPALGLMLYTAARERERAASDVTKDASRILSVLVAHEEQYVEGARQLLMALALTPQVRRADTRTCNALFARLVREHAAYANIGLARTDGEAIASGLPLTKPVNVADRAYFRGAMRTRDFAAGEYQVGRITNVPSINFGYPVLNSRRRVTGILWVALDLSALLTTVSSADLPEGTTLTILDGKGAVLARHPYAIMLIGRRVPEAPLVRTILRTKRGNAELVGLDGTSRLYVFTPLQASAEAPAAYVAAGIPSSQAYGDVNRVFALSLVGLALVGLVALAIAVWGGHVFFTRRIEVLAESARQLGTGDLTARASLVRGDDELTGLADTFDEMADSLQRRQAEKERAEEQLAWLATFPELDPYPVVETLLDGTITYTNPAAQRLFPDLEQLGTAHALLADIVTLAAKLKGGPQDKVARELRVGDRWYYRTVWHVPSRDRMRLYALDITDRKKAAAAVAESEERYRALVEASPDAVGVISPDGDLLFVNSAAVRLLCASSETQLVGKSVADVIRSDTAGHIRERLTRLLTRGESVGPVEEKLARFDGTTVDIEATLTPVTYSGEPAMQITARDITARKEVERVKSDFLAMVSHELRTPLAVVLGYATMIERSLKSGETGKCIGAAGKVHERTAHMARLVENLLDMSQIEAGTFTLNLESIDVGELVREVAASVPLGAGHALEVSIEKDLPTLSCDQNRLAIALTNLLANAVKFSPQGGKIGVAVATDGSSVSVSVADEGIGLAPSDHQRVFDLFTQADMSATRAFGGVGMGLYIARQIAEAHGGQVTVESLPGEGSTFTLEIPIEQAQSEEALHKIGS